ncbi:retrovirus-related pol polyprotein from transposon TNT 1-94, partial [Tanacetum coccineum]
IVQHILFIVYSGCTKHMTGNLNLLCNFVEKYLGNVYFGNDKFTPILGYGNLVQGYITINRVYYVEGLNHNLFSVGQFCDADLEVAFQKSTCFVRDLQGIDLLPVNRGSDLYKISLQEITSLTLIVSWLKPHQLKHGSSSVNKSSSPIDNSTPKDTIRITNAPTTTVTAEENNTVNQANIKVDNAYVDDNEFYNVFSTPVREEAESSSHYVDPSNMHTFYQPYQSEHRWTKDHALTQVRRNPSKPVQTRRNSCKLVSLEYVVCSTLTVSTAEPKTIKEAMADSAWIEAMQEELHQFDRHTSLGTRRQTIWQDSKGYAQEEGIDFEESFALVARLEAFRPDGFIDPDHPEKVYRLRKALYGLKQAPIAWYDELSNFLMSKGFTKGTIDPTLFTIRYGDDTLLVQIYVDDIIFGSTNLKFSKRFEKLRHSRFEMSLMGGNEILFRTSDPLIPTSVGTPMATKPKLDADLSGKLIDKADYCSKIRSLMYLTSSRPDIVQAISFLDADHARCLDTRKSTSGGIQFLGDKLVSWMLKKQNCTAMSAAKAEYVALSASCAQVMWMRTQLKDYGFNYN